MVDAALAALSSTFDEMYSAIGLPTVYSKNRDRLLEGDVALERAGPIYRTVFWPQHRSSNLAWERSAETLVHQFGQEVLQFITRAYGMQWPTQGYLVNLSRMPAGPGRIQLRETCWWWRQIRVLVLGV